MQPAPLTDWTKLHGDAFQGARVLVTGGAGFIGSHLTQALSILGAHVVVLDDLSGGTESNVAGLDRVELIKGSILDPAIVAKSMAGCALVFHQAALGSVPASVENPRKYVETNVLGTTNVLEAARAAKIQRVMFAASSSAYGDSPTLPKHEEMPPSPLSPYAASKVACEALMSAYANSYPVDTVSLRYFNIFGPRQNANSAYAAVIAAFAKSLLSNQAPIIFGDGEQSRDFTYVENAVHANLLAGRSNQPLRGTVLNVACGQRVTVNALAQRMATDLGKPHLKAIHKPARTGDVKHSLADLKKIEATIGYKPIVGWEPGLKRTLDWYANVKE